MHDDEATLTRYGTGYIYEVPNAGLKVLVTELRRSSEGTHAHLTFTTSFRGAATIRSDGRLFEGRYNLSSSTTSKTIAAMLEARYRVAKDTGTDWLGMVERMRSDVFDAEKGSVAWAPDVGEDEDYGDVEYEMDPFLPRAETSILYGPGGSFKSAIAQAFALSYATGRAVLPGVRPRGQGIAGFIDYETSRETFGRRLVRMAAGAQLEESFRGRIRYLHVSRPLVDIADRVQRLVEDAGIGLLIVDSTVAAMGAQGERGDVADSTVRLHEFLRRLGTTNLLVDHVDKSSQRQNGAIRNPYGSAFKTNYARDTWEVVADRTEAVTNVGLFNRKSNDRAPGHERAFQVTFADRLIEWSLGEVGAGLTDKSERRLIDRIREEMQDGGGYSAKELAERLGITNHNVRTQLNRHRELFTQTRLGRAELWALRSEPSEVNQGEPVVH